MTMLYMLITLKIKFLGSFCPVARQRSLVLFKEALFQQRVNLPSFMYNVR